uniref:RRM domain-containing protein n=1 Tax=Panagrellus redivivus TaxID=6233 RepID=A0A7E4W7E1_PANRE
MRAVPSRAASNSTGLALHLACTCKGVIQSLKMAPRVYVGRLDYRVHGRDLDDLFSPYGRIREILIKNGYAFVEFESTRDAEHAVDRLHNTRFMGESFCTYLRSLLIHAFLPAFAFNFHHVVPFFVNGIVGGGAFKLLPHHKVNKIGVQSQ